MRSYIRVDDEQRRNGVSYAKRTVRYFDPLLPTVGLVSLAYFAVLYAVDPDLYRSILRFWVPEPWSYPFLDLTSHLSQIECFAKGENVYITNSCDPLVAIHAPMGFNYSPLWLRLPWLVAIKRFMPLSGLCLAAGFLLALGFIPQPVSWKTRAVTVLGLLSGVVFFCIERENVDILMFLLALAGGLCLGRRSIARCAGYGLFTTAALLKYYPAVLLGVAAREKPRFALALTATIGGVAAVFIAAYHDELHQALTNVPGGSPFGDMWGAVILPAGVNELLAEVFDALGYHAAWADSLWHRHIVTAVMYMVMVPMSLILAIAMSSTSAIRSAVSLPIQAYLFLVLGGMVVSACFMLEPNIGYRGVWLLFVLPGLLILNETGPVRRLFGWAAAATLLVMWSVPVRRAIGFVIDIDPSPVRLPIVLILEWFIEQFAWWFLVTLLLTINVRFAMDGLSRWRENA